jgi:hypothetical protein
MSDDNQIYLPESFTALYVPPGKIKPSIGHREMAERYELCEDLANLLTEKAANMQFTLGITEELVLTQCEPVGRACGGLARGSALGGVPLGRTAELADRPVAAKLAAYITCDLTL